MFKASYIIAVLFFYIIAVMHISSCAKEYSYEGGLTDTIPINDTIPTDDTIPSTEIGFPQCQVCDITGEMSAPGWHFQYANALLCGYVTAAIMSPEHTAFTFFGPSACSADTGLVMTVYLDNFDLDSDTANVYAGRAVLEYYDNTDGSDILLSDEISRVQLLISSYDHASGIMRGRFDGVALTAQDNTASIAKGMFTIRFE